LLAVLAALWLGERPARMDGVEANVVVGVFPSRVFVNSTTNRIYVSNYGSNGVTVINGADNSTATVATGSQPFAVAVNSTTNRIYVGNYGGNNVTVINGVDNSTATVATGFEPIALAVNPTTNRIYLANFGSNNVTVINGADNSTATVAAGTSPRALAVNPIANRIYVANRDSNNVTVINGTNNSTATVAAGTSPWALAVNPTTNKIYVANASSGNVTVINGADNSTATVAAGDSPVAVTVNPTTNRIYVANYYGNTVTAINGADNSTSTISVGAQPGYLAVNTTTNKIYVSNFNSDSVTVINGIDNSTVNVAVGKQPYEVAINASTNKAYVANSDSANSNSGSVTVINGGAPTTPFPLTSNASQVTTTSATLNGSVSPNGLSTAAWFEWGTDSTLTNRQSTTQQTIGAGTTNQPIVANLSGLSPGLTYYFRAVGSSSAGTARGAILSFSTGGTISGRITNKNGSGLQGRTVKVTGSPGTFTSAPSDANGNYTVVGVPFGASYSATADGSGETFSTYGQPSGSLSPFTSNVTGLNFAKTTPQYAASGTVTISGGDLTGLSVTAVASGEPGDGRQCPGPYTAGHFECLGLSQSTSYSITPVKANYVFAPTQLTVSNDISTLQFVGTPLPTVTTASATSITQTTATLNGSVNPNGIATTGWFEYGTDPTLTTNTLTPTQTIGSGTSAQAMTANLINLTSGTAYYFRAVASNSAGPAKGSIFTFTTTAAPVVSIAVSPASATEDGVNNLVYTLTRSVVTTGAITVNFSVGGTATFNGDYTQSGATTFTSTTGTIAFASGETTKTVTVNPTGDTTVEPNETVVLTVSSGSTYIIGSPSSATGTITNDDTDVTLAVSPSSVNEDGATNLGYTFTRNGVTTGGITVNFSVSGTATFNTDYVQSGATTFTSTTGTIAFASGETTKTVTVDPTVDATVEPNETVILTVASGSGYSAGSPSSATGTITNDDTDVTVAVSPSSVNEDGATNLVYTFSRTSATNNLTVNFSVGGTATFNSDYAQSGATTFTSTTGTVAFAAGETSKAVTVDPTVDTTVEPNETVILTVASGSGYNVASPGSATGTINNDDTDVSVAVSPSSVNEDGSANLAYTFTRSGVTTGAITVNFTVAGTATFNSDYTQNGATAFTLSTGTIAFASGETTRTVTIDPTVDAAVEPNETVVLTVASGTGYSTGSPSSATGTITNDDATPGVQFSQSTYNVTEGVPHLDVIVTRVGDTSGTASVSFATSDNASSQFCNVNNGVASSRCDYEARFATLKFAAGETSKTIAILIDDDAYLEGPETFSVNLANPSGASLGGISTATVTINDNDLTNGTNPIDGVNFFVTIQYLDFLNREPDAPGFGFWTGNINNCTPQPSCTESARVTTSGAFYVSVEFQQTGYLVERIYKTSYGDATGISTLQPFGTHVLAVPIVRLNEFLLDTQQIGQGVVVLQPGWEQLLASNKQAFMVDFVQRTRFANVYPTTLTPAQFVDALNANAGNVLSASERTTAINLFGGAGNTANATARAQALRQVAEDSDLYNAEFSRAFVLMQYFGYLRRNPNDLQDTDYSGYEFWLNKMNAFSGDYLKAEMVKAFITSPECRQRFGP
jgi:YVTN family beta-propeller protein